MFTYSHANTPVSQSEGAYYLSHFIKQISNDYKMKWSPGGGGYSHTLPIRVCAPQRGRDFEAPDLEWGIHFRGVFKNGA